MTHGSAKSGGPLPKYSDYHIWKAIETLDGRNTIGRKKLAELLGIGEGSTRSIISIMQEQGLVTIGKSGILLTAKGMEFRKKTHMEIAPDIDVDGLTIGEANVAVRIPKMARSVKYGCEERDAAIKSGASGATTLIYTGGKLSFPGSDHPVDAKAEESIRSCFQLKSDDVIIIGTGPTLEAAEIGAVNAGLAILGGMRFGRELEDILSSRSSGSELISLAFAIHDLVGGLPVCAKSRDNLGIRIENGKVIDNAYTGQVLEEVISAGTTIRKIAVSGPYKGIRVIVTPIELDNRIIAAIGVVDIRSMAGANNLIRLRSDDNERDLQGGGRRRGVQETHSDNGGRGHGYGPCGYKERMPQRAEAFLGPEADQRVLRSGSENLGIGDIQAGGGDDTPRRVPGHVRHHKSDRSRGESGSETRLQHPFPGRGRNFRRQMTVRTIASARIRSNPSDCIHFFTTKA